MLIIVVLGLGLGGAGEASGFAATAILWVAYLFGGVLCFEKTMAMERHDGAMAALLAAPIDHGVLFVAKLLSNLALIFVLVLVITPVAILLFAFDLSWAPWTFAGVTALSLVGFTAVGTLLAAAASSSRLAGGLLSVLIFPICLPVVVTSTQMLLSVFRDHEPLTPEGVGVLVAFDAIYLVVSWLVFERVLEP
ncbi:MAG: heme exporter protein CcmB [Planctomycetota bacterium]|nr:heme exporter protein CcmB [Planctomycetota bacterium]